LISTLETAINSKNSSIDLKNGTSQEIMQSYFPKKSKIIKTILTPEKKTNP
jgi:hypothetical protein